MTFTYIYIYIYALSLLPYFLYVISSFENIEDIKVCYQVITYISVCCVQQMKWFRCLTSNLLSVILRQHHNNRECGGGCGGVCGSSWVCWAVVGWVIKKDTGTIVCFWLQDRVMLYLSLLISSLDITNKCKICSVCGCRRLIFQCNYWFV